MEKLDFGKGAVPLYIQIKKIIKDKILSKEYAPGDSLPSEAQLQEIFHVSRITARQAIAQLESEGLVERARGKGTRVLFQNKIEEQLAGIKSFTNEMLERGIQPGTRWAHIELVKADRHVADIFGCKKGDLVYRLDRVRTGDRHAGYGCGDGSHSDQECGGSGAFGCGRAECDCKRYKPAASAAHGTRGDAAPWRDEPADGGFGGVSAESSD